jgi:SAM-dependent methyltransferase
MSLPPSPNRHYHDRVANRYDEIYKGPRWDAWYELSWDGLKPHLPSDLRAPIVDLGCGTGKYGLRLAKSGYTVTLSDLSHGMLEVARRKAAELGLTERTSFIQADIGDLKELPREHFALAIAQGDVLSFAEVPGRALKEVRKILRPGGVFVASVDQAYAAIQHYAEKEDLEGLERLLTRGEMEWLANDPSERFPVHTFTAESLRALLEKAGLEVLDIFGKTVLPFKKLEALFQDPKETDRILALEKKLCRKASALGLASHLQFAAKLK